MKKSVIIISESHDVEEDDLLSEENVEEEAVEEDSADCQISSYKEVTQVG